MPHLHLETTSDLPENAHVPDILQALTSELSRHETIDPRHIKAYHTLRSVWVMGEGGPAGFAHLTVMVLTGRPLELRRKIAEALMAVLRKEFLESHTAEEVSLTVEVREMDRDTYLR